ncbi:MAG TPA: DUF5752 family protein [Anaerolineales bacterium]|nr:DUF5752 family protein [Anaerolineales bacterium]
MTSEPTSLGREPVAHILVVEDSLGVARSLSLALGLYREGIFRAETCASAEEALEKLHAARFDLIVSDLRLPGMDGLALLERARQVSPRTRSILITAFGSPTVELRATQLANAYLAKPFQLQDLVRLAERVLTEPAPGPLQASELPLTSTGLQSADEQTVLRKSVHLTVLACDLDGTLGENGLVAPATWEMLKAAKTSGMVIFLVTGRALDSFASSRPFNELCEAIVAENGAVVHFPRRDALMLPFGRVDAGILHQLETLGVPLERGMAIAATVIPNDELVLRVLRENRWGATIEYNRNAVMLLPTGATKGNGLRYALEELGYSPHNVVACGDGENDRSLFEVAELSAAVANARPSLRTMADVILPEANGAGVSHLIRNLLEGTVPARRRKPERQGTPGRKLQLGYRMSGSHLLVDPYNLVETNLGIFGSSGSGKSWLAGLLAEELLKQKYQVCIIDPEGDYRGLAASPRTLLLGGPETPLPPVADVLNIAEWNNISLVLDLSLYKIDQRLEYLESFLRTLRGLRARRGRPHYFLVDEIQSFCPVEGGPLTDQFLEAMQWGGFGLISYRPSLLAPAILDQLDHILVTRLALSEEVATLTPYLEHYSPGPEALEQLAALPRGHAYLYTPKDSLLPGAETLRFRVSNRTIPHIRHLHKYLRAPLPEHKRFYFNQPDGRALGQAANLWEFREQLGRLPPSVIAYHLERGDFAHWLQEVLHDEELARRITKVAGRGLSGEPLRQALLEVVIDRYEELESQA